MAKNLLRNSVLAIIVIVLFVGAIYYVSSNKNPPKFSQTQIVYVTFSAKIASSTGVAPLITSNVLEVDGTYYRFNQLPVSLAFSKNTKHQYSFSPTIFSQNTPYKYVSIGGTCGFTKMNSTFNATSSCNATATYIINSTKHNSTVTTTSVNTTVTSTIKRNTTTSVNTTITTTIPQNSFYLNMSNNYNFTNATTPKSGYYLANDVITISAKNSIGGDALFLNWNGYGLGSYTGPNSTAIVVMRGNVDELANYKVYGTTTVTTVPTTSTTTICSGQCNSTNSSYVGITFRINATKGVRTNASNTQIVLKVNNVGYKISQLPLTLSFVQNSLNNYVFVAKFSWANITYTFNSINGCGFTKRNANFTATYNCTATANYH